VHRWIFSILSRVSKEVNEALHNFRFHEAAQTIYHFFWGDFCDWYIEWVKPQLSSADRETAVAAWRNIFAVLEAALRLLHPVMPFLTEELWHRLPQARTAHSIAWEQFPDRHPEWEDADAEKNMKLLQEIIIAARNIRAEMKLDPKHRGAAELSTGDPALSTLVGANLDPLLRLAVLSSLQVSSAHLDPSGATIRSTAKFDLRIASGEPMDKQAEIGRLKKELERLSKDIESKRKRLADESFRSKAPAEIVRNLEATLAGRQIELQKLRERLQQLE
jgi:valyl-tRNA synthetase